MEVTLEKGKRPVYHIWDNDNREIACHKQDVAELIRKLQEALRKEQKNRSLQQ